MVYGHQQWSGLKDCDWETLKFLYHSVAMVKNAENDASRAEREKAQRAEDERRRREEHGHG